MELDPNNIDEQISEEVEASNKYNVDIVMCIDITGSMNNLIDDVKQTAISFAPIMREQMENSDRPLDNLRVKVIGFRDYYNDEDALVESNSFFSLPNEQNELESFINDLEAKGGGPDRENIPESGLEAFYYALENTNWTTSPNARHVITLLTDAPPRELNTDNPERDDYPENMPNSIAELESMWNNDEIISQDSKRLVLFAPKLDEQHVLTFNDLWHQVGEFENTDWNQTKATQGLEDTRLKEIISAICESIGGNSVNTAPDNEETQVSESSTEGAFIINDEEE